MDVQQALGVLDQAIDRMTLTVADAKLVLNAFQVVTIACMPEPTVLAAAPEPDAAEAGE